MRTDLLPSSPSSAAPTLSPVAREADGSSAPGGAVEADDAKKKKKADASIAASSIPSSPAQQPKLNVAGNASGDTAQRTVEDFGEMNSAPPQDENRTNTGTHSSGAHEDPDDVKEARRERHNNSSPVVFRAEVTKEDILALNAKYKVEARPDIAGDAARAATFLKNTAVDEVHFLKFDMILLWAAFIAFLFLVYTVLHRYAAARAAIAGQRGADVTSQIVLDTMLPWWGNDGQYESQVKRIFVEEWRRARGTAQRQRTFQDGVARESLPLEEKERLDLEIFTVTQERLQEMKKLADSTPGRR